MLRSTSDISLSILLSSPFKLCLRRYEGLSADLDGPGVVEFDWYSSRESSKISAS